MNRFLIITLPFALAAGFLAAAPVPRDGGKNEYYFPTRVGTKWVYDEKDGKGYAQIVTESVEKSGRFLVTVKSTSVDFKDDDSTTSAQYEVSKDGFFGVADGVESKDTRVDYDPPYCILKLPHLVGERWGNCPRYEAGKVEKVKVPAGTFDAIRVDQRGEKSSWWYAPGVGCVKYSISDSHMEMKSFALPKE